MKDNGSKHKIICSAVRKFTQKYAALVKVTYRYKHLNGAALHDTLLGLLSE